MSIVSASDFTGYLGFVLTDITVKQRVEDYIEFHEPILLIDILTKDGYDVYNSMAESEEDEIDFEEFETLIRPALVRLMYFNLIQEMPETTSVNGTITFKLENATYTTNEVKLSKIYNDGIRIYNIVVDWLTEQTDIAIYSNKYKTRYVFGI